MLAVPKLRTPIGPLVVCLILLVAMVIGRPAEGAESGPDGRPNVLFVIAEDQSWMHVGAYGNKAVNTPAFDRLAREGVLFNYAYCACPSCTASRNAILTGQAIWRLEEGGVFGCTLPRKFPVFPLLLEKAGYRIGWTGKCWGPGDLRAGGWGKQHPAGKHYTAKRKHQSPLLISGADYAAGFEAFLDAGPRELPFFFWCGTHESHRGFRKGSGLKSGKKLADCGLPGHLPDVPQIRSDLLDYCLEIDYLDWQVGKLLEILKKRGQLANTIVIVTSDHGMPFPRAKANLYDMGTRVPLVVYCESKFPGGRVVDDFVSLTDVGPTILEAAGISAPQVMTGRGLMRVLGSDKSGLVDPRRDRVVLAQERHTHYRKGGLGYPVRAIRTHSHMYIRNCAPDRWAAGDPRHPRLRRRRLRQHRPRPDQDMDARTPERSPGGRVVRAFLRKAAGRGIV